MSLNYEIAKLPTGIRVDEAIIASFGKELDFVEDRLRKKMSIMVECEMELTSHLTCILRERLKVSRAGGSIQVRIVTGRPPEGADQGPRASILTLMLREIEELVRCAEPKTVIVIPHLDLLTTTTRSSLSDFAKEVIALLYENPDVVFLGFKDPSFELPEPVCKLFIASQSFIGIPRDQLTKIILQKEARKFGTTQFDPFRLYKYVSGITPVRFRQIMTTIQDRVDYDDRNPAALKKLYADIRRLTIAGDLEVPRVDIDKDIGGYKEVKEKIKEDVISLYNRKDLLTNADEIKAIEELIPKGIIFEGPPGTGKTFLAKAIATILDATVIVVSGPELKSKWVGDSESNLRNVFARARQNAPSIIIFDEIDSFATRRGTYTGSGVEHSMVNQLLTEMDGFRKEELVFVIGTTNFATSLDAALLRPGRFELVIEIPYPNEEDRKEILEIYKKKFDLDLSDKMIEYIVSKTGGYSNYEHKTRFSGDHLYAICRSLGREMIRKGKHAVTKDEIDKSIDSGFSIRPPTDEEKNTIAVHECGHALVAIVAEHCPAPDKVCLQQNNDIIPGYVRQEEWKGDYVRTREDLYDQICVCLGGRAAEMVVIGRCTSGAQNDLEQANNIARIMIEKLGMYDDLLVITEKSSETTKLKVEERIKDLLQDAMNTAETIIKNNREAHTLFLNALKEKSVLYKEDLKKIAEDNGKAFPKFNK